MFHIFFSFRFPTLLFSPSQLRNSYNHPKPVKLLTRAYRSNDTYMRQPSLLWSQAIIITNTTKRLFAAIFGWPLKPNWANQSTFWLRNGSLSSKGRKQQFARPTKQWWITFYPEFFPSSYSWAAWRFWFLVKMVLIQIWKLPCWTFRMFRVLDFVHFGETIAMCQNSF